MGKNTSSRCVSDRTQSHLLHPPPVICKYSGDSFCEGKVYFHEFYFTLRYCDPPAGVKLEEGQHYNPYFAGGVIGMAPPLYNEIIEYEDGTPATQSQVGEKNGAFAMSFMCCAL